MHVLVTHFYLQAFNSLFFMIKTSRILLLHQYPEIAYENIENSLFTSNWQVPLVLLLSANSASEYPIRLNGDSLGYHKPNLEYPEISKNSLNKN